MEEESNPNDPSSESATPLPVHELCDADEDSTTIVSPRNAAKLARHEPRDRHLLVRLNGADRGKVTRLRAEPMRIGRSQDSEIFVNDDGVSRKHALISPFGPTYLLEDKASANGTFVHGERVYQHVLREGDTLQIGLNVSFRYTLTDAGQETLLRQLFEASVTDALTGAHNRDYFDTQLKAELSFARRHKTLVSLLLFDVDHFKRVNDTYGHLAGDEVLVQIARSVRPVVRNEDVFARYGGEEFALILRGVELQGARALAERLRKIVQSLEVPSEHGPIRVTMSVGCATTGGEYTETPEVLLSLADSRLYRAKHAGRNRVIAQD